MINKIKLTIIKNFLFNIYLFNKKKKHKIRDYEYNFENIIFVNLEDARKKFLLNKRFKNNEIEKDFSFHFFDWLIAAKIIGGAESVSRAKKNILRWHIKKYKKNHLIWSSIFVSRRFTNLLYNYDFYAVSASISEKKVLHEIILEHYLLIRLELQTNTENIDIENFKSFFLGSLIYNENINSSLKLLSYLIFNQIDKYGLHKSYNPLEQAKFLNHLQQIKNMILFFKLQVPDDLSFQILNLTSTLLSLIHKDRSLPLFNGANNMYNEKVEALANQEKDVVSKNLNKINNGLAIYNDKSKKIIMDVVRPTNNIINKNLHASTLAFEFSCMGEKIITNCGSIEKKIGDTPEYLRFSAAHSTIILNNTNISELVLKKSYKRIPKKIIFSKDEDKSYINWHASHDGYLQNFYKIIKRKISISKNTNKIIGEDSIITNKINEKKNFFSIRFHLMPDCNCLITNDHYSVIIKTKKGQNWIFKSDSKIYLEDSIYIGKGKLVEQNKQIVINGAVHDTKIIKKWSLTQS